MHVSVTTPAISRTDGQAEGSVLPATSTVFGPTKSEIPPLACSAVETLA